MIIDVHVHCAFFKDICEDSGRVQFRRNEYALHKTGPADMEQTLTVMDFAKIDKSILLPLDLTTVSGDTLVSNQEVHKLVNLQPDRFIGFASVDPYRPDASEVTEYAFKDLRLTGLKLNLSRLKLYPMDKRLTPLYDLCIKYNRPIMFHAGLSWEPNAPARYGRPIEYEDLAMAYPTLRFCLAHFGWPWVDETVMLMIKFPNVYTDTSLLYLDSPKRFFDQIFMKNMGPTWIEHNFLEQVMFGSNAPRFRPARIREGVESLPMRKGSMEKILGLNAEKFLGLGGQ
ncbi:MAG TPA: amidohydrolase [Thermoanaerobacterales bacterium]|nr:amidohydrolase [Thermoanaerobacterales bacterium]